MVEVERLRKASKSARGMQSELMYGAHIGKLIIESESLYHPIK